MTLNEKVNNDEKWKKGNEIIELKEEKNDDTVVIRLITYRHRLSI